MLYICFILISFLLGIVLLYNCLGDEYDAYTLNENDEPILLRPHHDEALHTNKEEKEGKFYPFDMPPRALNLQDIQRKVGYPEAAREMNLEGKITFRLLIDEYGCYIHHLPPKSGHPLFIKAIEPHLAAVHFAPAIHNGMPTKCWIDIPFVFKLI